MICGVLLALYVHMFIERVKRGGRTHTHTHTHTHTEIFRTNLIAVS